MNVRQLAARVEGPGAAGLAPPASRAPDAPGSAFADALRHAERGAAPDDGITLSAHAERRIEARGISLDAAERQSLADAVRLLDAKGAREALLLRADAAFVVSVPSRTVVTAVSTDEMRDRAFTQIDSAFVL